LNKNKKKKKNGFSLIEVLIGLVLLAIGLLAIAGMQITSVRGNFFSSNLSQAAVVGQDCLETLRNLPYGHAYLIAGSHPGPWPQPPFNPWPSSFPGTADYTVSVIPGTTMLNIMVNVRWKDTTDHVISFTTIRSQ